MRETGRYDTSDLVENQHQPGSRGRVLRNLVAAKTVREINAAEYREFKRLTREAIHAYDRDHIFTAEDLRALHRSWLQPIYPWAGQYRQVVMSKGGFTFAFPEFIPKLMGELEEEVLRRYTPCRGRQDDDLAWALAVVHTELLLIHPFREGNGRIARLLAMLMALQAGMPPLDFSGIKGKKREDYFSAVRAGLDKEYGPMKGIFNDVLLLTLKTCAARAS
ncbi:MAG: Fic family protein [Smithellaceae bacterium]|nr:Fic family protein [Smithellaceae bacterium]